MKESTLKFLKCSKCNKTIDLEIYENKTEIIEGILRCNKCELMFPIIDKIPIMLIDFKKYISEHKILSGKLYRLASNKEMKKSFVYISNLFISCKLMSFIEKNLNYKFILKNYYLFFIAKQLLEILAFFLNFIIKPAFLNASRD